jgi:CheY-like chemotaxis protein
MAMASRNILVVDDVEVVFSAFKEELGNAGFEVDTALSSKAAIEKARAKKYDIIFIDMVMPEVDGIEICRALKDISPDSRLVAMTGQIYSGLADKELEFRRAGGKVYFLYKPFLEGEILQITRKALSDTG